MGALIHSKLALIHTALAGKPMRFRRAASFEPTLSDRMSRSEIAHRSPFPPTASQVVTTDIASDIIESKNLDVLAACSNGLGWALHVADGCWLYLSMLVWWRSRFLAHWHQWHGSRSYQW